MTDRAGVRPTVRMNEGEIWDFLSNGHTGIFVTLRQDGTPVAMPIWFAVVDRKVYIGTRGKKLVRVRNDPRASFLVESGERWAELKAVHLTGDARVLEEVPEDLLARIQTELDRKYAAYRTASKQMPDATRNVYAKAGRQFVEFTPDERVLNWDNAKLGLA